MESKFKVVYLGKLKPGTDAEEFVARFSKIFRVSVDKARRLLHSNKEVVLKKGLDSKSADIFREKLDMIGMRVRVEPMPSQEPVFQPSLAPMAPMAETDSHQREMAGGGVAGADPGRCPKCGSQRIEEDSCLDCGIVISKYRSIMHEREADGAAADDPYAAPQANLVEEAEAGEMTGPVARPIGHGWSWLAQGFDYFKCNPWAWIGALLAWVGISILAEFIPIVGPLAIQLVSAVIFAGFMLGTHAQEQGGNFQASNVFAGFSNSNVGQLLLLGVIYLVGMLLILAVVGMMLGVSFAMMGGMEGLEQNPDQMMEMMADPTGIILTVLVVFALMIPLMMAWFFAPALIAIEGLSALAAIKLSFVGCLKNILPFLLYGIIATLLLILGALPLGLGLLVVGPMFIASIYAAYRDIYYA